MSSSKKPDGCAVMMRRTFLFLLGLAAAKFLHSYFIVPLNRENFWRFLGEFIQKARSIFDSELSKNPTPQPNLPDNPVIPSVGKKPPNLPPSPTPEKTITPPGVTSPQVATPPGVTSPTVATPPGVTSPTVATPPGVGMNKKASPLGMNKKTLNGISFYQTTINLKDPATFITIALANNATQANSATKSYGDEDFAKLVQRNPGAVVINGTFFSKDAQKRVMGNMIAEGRVLKYSQWENFGTTLGLKANNEPEMITARRDGKPQWDQHWFSLTCGPRLLRDGKVWLAPKLEGFSDPHVFDVGGRTAIGFNQEKDRLFLVTFLDIVSLEDEAALMQAIGCYQAMNLDGGASKCLAYRGKILVNGGRPLTNVLVAYDLLNPAPQRVKDSWVRFQQGERPQIPV